MPRVGAWIGFGDRQWCGLYIGVSLFGAWRVAGNDLEILCSVAAAGQRARRFGLLVEIGGRQFAVGPAGYRRRHVSRVVANAARIKHLHLGAGATRIAVLLITLEIAQRGGIRHREEVAVAGAHAHCAEFAAKARQVHAVGLIDHGADTAFFVGIARLVQRIGQISDVAQKPIEQISIAVLTVRFQDRRTFRRHDAVATAIGVERSQYTRAIAARAAVGKLRALDLQGIEIGDHAVERGLECGASVAIAPEQQNAAAGAVGLAACL